MQESATLIVWKQYTYVRKEYSVMVKSIPTMERLNPTYVIISRIVTSFLESCGKSENGQWSFHGAWHLFIESKVP